MSEDRDNSNLRQFKSRAKQPKILCGSMTASCTMSPSRAHNIYDSGFGGISDQIDDTRYNYMGTSPSLSRYITHPSLVGRACMHNSFHERHGY